MDIPAGFEPVDEVVSLDGFEPVDEPVGDGLAAGEAKAPTMFAPSLVAPATVMDTIPDGFEPDIAATDVPAMEDSWAEVKRKTGRNVGTGIISMAPYAVKAFSEMARDPDKVMGGMLELQSGVSERIADILPVPDPVKDVYRKGSKLATQALGAVGMMFGQQFQNPVLPNILPEKVDQFFAKKVQDANAEIAILSDMFKDNRIVADTWSAKGIAGTVGSSLGENMGPLALGIATKNVGAATSAMFGNVALKQYVDSRVNRNRGVGLAFADSIMMGAAEIVGEQAILKNVLESGAPLLKRTLGAFLSEAGQEMFTEVLQTGYAAGVFGDDVTLKDAISQVAYAGVVGGLSGTMMAPIGHAVDVSRTKAGNRQLANAVKEIEYNLLYPSDQELTDDKVHYQNGAPGRSLLTPREEKRYLELTLLEHVVKDRIEKVGNSETLTEAQLAIQNQKANLDAKRTKQLDEGGQILLPSFEAAVRAEDFGTDIRFSLPIAEMESFLWNAEPRFDSGKYEKTSVDIAPPTTVDIYKGHNALKKWLQYEGDLETFVKKELGDKPMISLFVRKGLTGYYVPISPTDKPSEPVYALQVPITEIQDVVPISDSVRAFQIKVKDGKTRFVGRFEHVAGRPPPVNPGVPPVTSGEQLELDPSVMSGQQDLFGYPPVEDITLAPPPTPEEDVVDKGLNSPDIEVEEIGLQGDFFTPTVGFEDAGPNINTPPPAPPAPPPKKGGKKTKAPAVPPTGTTPPVTPPTTPPSTTGKVPFLKHVGWKGLVSFQNYYNSHKTIEHGDKKKIFDVEVTPGQVEFMTDKDTPLMALDDVRQELSDFAQDIVTKFMPTANVILLWMPRRAGAWGDILPIMEGDEFTTVIRIGIPKVMTSREKLALYETLAHELGHAISYRHFFQAPALMKALILDKYREWQNKYEKQTIAEGAGTSMMGTQALSFMYGPRAGNLTASLTNQDYDPMFSFPEWFANQIAKYYNRVAYQEGSAQNNRPTTRLGKFFKSIASEIRAVYRELNNVLGGKEETEPQDWVEDFLQFSQTQGILMPPGLDRLPNLVDQRPKSGAPKKPRAPRKPKTPRSPMTIGADDVTGLMRNMATGLDVDQLGFEMDRYNKYVHKAFNILHLLEKNKHIIGLRNYVDELQQWHHITKMPWVSRGDEILKHWHALGAKVGDGLGKLMYDLTLMDHWPTDQEFAAMAQARGLNRAGLEVYQELKKYFNDYLNEFEKVQIANATKNIVDLATLGQEIAAIKADYAEMRKRPYFPLSRFGDYTLVVKEGGNTIHMESFESKRERDAAFGRVKRMFPKAAVQKSKIAKESQVFRYLPPAFGTRLKTQLNLTPAQQEELDQMLYQFVPGASFRHHFQRRGTVGGWNEDAQRTFASYALHGANHLARAKHLDALKDAIAQIDDTIRVAAKSGQDTNTTTRVEIADYLRDHLDYIINPPNEFAALRALGFMWFMGFNVKSAVVNLTQTPFVTMPHLGAVFGTGKTATAMKNAMLDLKQMYRGKNWQPNSQLLKALDMGVRQGFLNESQATELAGVAEGSLIGRLKGGSALARKFLNLSQWGAMPMQITESFNRRLAFRAAWDLAMKDPMNPYVMDSVELGRRLFDELTALEGFTIDEAKAFITARRVVMKTQYEYSSYARPEMMRGWKAPVLQFYQYMTNTLWNFKNTEGGTMMLLMYLMAGGLMGLPFAKDIDALVQYLCRAIGKKEVDIERELREVLVALGSEHPDLWMNGASRYGFGLGAIGDMMGMPLPTVDLSASMSFGNVIPGVSAIESPGDYNAKFYQASTDIVGAAFGAGLGMLEAINSDNPDEFKRWERAMPTALRNVSRAYRWSEQGREKTNNGSTVVEFRTSDPEEVGEVIGQALGFAPTRLTQKWDLIAAQNERVNFYKMRRAYLLQYMNHAMTQGDTAEVSNAMKKIREYNSNLPTAGLAISGETIQRSRRATIQRQRYQQAGVPYEKAYRALSSETQMLYPEMQQTPRVEDLK